MKTLKPRTTFGSRSGTLLLVISMVSGFGPLACSVTGPLREDAKAEGYTLAKLPSHWKKEELGAEADAVFYSATTKSLISVNSVCDRYTDSRLETLTQDLLSPMKAVKVVHQEDLKISDRRALFTRAEGQIDGVSVQMSVIVLRKNRCLFDFSLFGTGITDAERREFMSFVQGFRYQEASR